MLDNWLVFMFSLSQHLGKIFQTISWSWKVSGFFGVRVDSPYQTTTILREFPGVGTGREWNLPSKILWVFMWVWVAQLITENSGRLDKEDLNRNLGCPSGHKTESQLIFTTSTLSSKKSQLERFHHPWSPFFLKTAQRLFFGTPTHIADQNSCSVHLKGWKAPIKR